MMIKANENLIPYPNSPWGFSFFSWQGNQISFEQSSWLFYLIFGLSVLSLIFIFIFKNNIYNFSLKHNKGINLFFWFFGIFLFFLFILRILILSLDDYPLKWELIPLHFCRFFLVCMIFSLLIKKYHYVKYYGFFAIGGAIFAILLADLKNNEYWQNFGGIRLGYDSFIFWDFVIVHNSLIIIPILLFTCTNVKISKLNTIFTISIILIITLIIFFLDTILSNNQDIGWRANWFYLSTLKNNGVSQTLSKFIGSLGIYPMILFTFIVIGLIMYFMQLWLFFIIDKFNIYKIKSKIKIEIIKSSKWNYFKNN